MTKLSEKFEKSTAVELVLKGGRRKMLAETERRACAHALAGGLANWEKRCAALYQVIGYMAHEFGVFDHKDVHRALDVACGRGDVERLLPWPNERLQPSNARNQHLEEAALICEALMDTDDQMYRTAARDCALAIRQGRREEDASIRSTAAPSYGEKGSHGD